MKYRIEPHNPRSIVRVDGDGVEEPFLVVFDPAATAAVVIALNAHAGLIEAAEETTRAVVNTVTGSVHGLLVQGHTINGVRA